MDTEEPYRILFQNHPHPIWIYDEESLRFLAVNDAAVRDYGYSHEEFQGMTLHEIHVPEDVPALIERLPHLTDSERHRLCRHRAKDGRVIDVEIATHSLRFQGFRARIVLAHDVTGRRAAENALREAHETLHAVIQAAPVAIVAMDFDGNVRSWNRAAEQMFGWKEEEVLNRPFPIVPEEDLPFFRGNVEGARWGKTVAGIERQRLRKDGTRIDVSLWNAVQRDGSGNAIGVISVIADITERKRLEEALRQSQKMEAIGKLAGGIAHDFNNLMTVVTGFGQLLLDSLPPGHPQRPQVEEVIKAGERAAALTGELLAFSRRQMIRPRILDLNHLIHDIEKPLRAALPENIELLVKLDSGVGRVRVDRSQFEQAILNLALNAREAMPEGGRLTLETSSQELTPPSLDELPDLGPGRYVLLSVTDTGKGMDEETKRRVFEPFFTTKGLGRGTGLGLSTVYGIVKQNGGDVAVSSQIGQGSCFRIYLPQSETPAESLQPSRDLPGLRGSETVLLVDDEPSVRQLTRDMLRRQGYVVLEAAGGREALRLARKHTGPIDVLLTDVVMPHMSGPRLSEQLLSLHPRLKVIYLSGYAEHLVAEHGIFERGPFLQKPFTAEALAQKLREVLGQGRPLAEVPPPGLIDPSQA